MMRYAEANASSAEIVQAFKESTVLPAREAFERGDNEEGATILTEGIGGKRMGELPASVMQRRMQNIEAARSLALSDDEFPLLDPAKLAALSMPVLLVSGKNTAPVHGEIFKAVQEVISGARVRIVEGAGHSVSQQKPDVFNAEVLAFLQENGLTY